MKRRLEIGSQITKLLNYIDNSMFCYNKSGVDQVGIRWRRVMKAEIKGTKKRFVGGS